jgi:iron(III) transport system ATP-binding protein
VLLLDEPFSSLDVARRAEVRAEVTSVIRAEGTTALLVTHDHDEALSMGDRVAIMSEGRILQVGTPEEVYREPATAEVAGLLGDANLLHGEVKRGVLHTGAGAIRTDAAFGPSLAVIRPEDVELEVAARGNARVVGVEYFGADQRVTVLLDSGETVRARLHSRRQFELGTRVRVRLGGVGPKVFRAPRAAPNARGAPDTPK